MALVGIAKNVNAQKFSMGLNLPVMDGLVGCWLGGTNGLWKNQAAGGISSTIIGSPTHVTENTTRFSSSAYIDTNIAEIASPTIIVVGKVYAPGGSITMQMFGNYYATITEAGNSRNAPGSGVVFDSTGAQWMVGASYSGVAGASSDVNSAILAAETGLAASLDAAGESAWRCMFGQIDGAGMNGTAGNRYIKNLTKAAASQKALVTGNVRDMRNPGTYHIGTRGLTGTATAPTEMLMAILWDRALTDSEQESMYDYVKSFAARRGISV